MSLQSKHLAGVCLIAILAGAPALAQENGEPATVSAGAADDERTLDAVRVTGIRGSLQQSLDVKRNANQVVDAVSAEDVGKFPDANVAEALQRITGVSIDRSGGEGQFITVRGLGPEFNTVLLNGRTLATDNAGREFSFDVLSSDIIQRAEVFKTANPELQSGGIGSVVNVVTARPFDRPGTNLTLSAAGIYDTLREEVSPDLTAVGSWTNRNNTLGFLLGASYSDRKTQEDSSFTNGFALRDGAPIIDAPENSTGLDASAIVPLPSGRIQQQVVHSRDTQDRQRLTLNSTAQARPAENVTLTFDALYSQFDVSSFATQFSGFFNPPFIDPVLDENGTVVSFSRPGVDFLNRNPLIANTVGLSQNDNVLTSNNRKAETFLFGLNGEWEVVTGLKVHGDISHSRATRDGTNPFVVLGALAPTSPLIQLPNDNGISTITNLVGLTDPTIQRLHLANVNRSKVDDNILEFKGGIDWEVDRGPLQSVSVGGLFTDREKAQTGFDSIGDSNGFEIFCAFCGYTVPFDTSILQPFSFNGFLSGVPGADAVPAEILTASFADAFRVLNDTANILNPNRTGGNSQRLLALRDAPGADPVFGFFTPALNAGASFEVAEQITSAYLNTQWGGDFGGTLDWGLNVGFRVALTETISTGVDQPVIEFRETPGDTVLVTVFGPTTDVSVRNEYVNFLPAVNLKVSPTEDTILRLSYSETVTRPTLTALGVANTFGGRSNAPISGGGNPNLEAFESENYDVSFEWYFDEVSFFSIAGFHKEFSNFLESQTLPVPREIIFPAGNGGRTMDEVVVVDFQDTRDRNGETGAITGVEIAIQKTFDTLPGLWSGLGAAANYTYVTSNIDRAMGSGASDCDYNGLSPHSFNISGFYEKGPYQARLAYNFRDEFLFQCFSFFSEPQERESFGQLDFSAAYSINDRFQVFVEGINVTDADTRDFSRFRNRFLSFSDTGSRYQFGVRATF